MLLTYREIKSENHHAPSIWLAERKKPRWWLDADRLWTPTYCSYLRFWDSCGEIWGLFDREHLVAAVYLEFLDPRTVNVHISVIGNVPRSELTRFFVSLKVQKTSDGVIRQQAWLLKKNRELIKAVTDAGFNLTGLKMDHGESHGRLLRWVEMRG